MELFSRRVATAILIFFLPVPALAWAPETRVRMVDDAVRLMPRSLRTVLESRREELLRGMLAPLVTEDEAGHRPPWFNGTLDRSVEAAAGELSEGLKEPGSFDTLAELFGNLAHFIADAGYPPGVGSAESGRRYSHFSQFCASRAEKFPLVFYGHDDPLLAEHDYLGYARAMMTRARRDDVNLARAYSSAGDPPPAAGFDDRSVPFAIGSLGYSRSVTDIVRVWLAVWAESNGDLGFTPYRHPKPKQRRP